MKNTHLLIVLFSLLFTNCKEKDEVLNPVDILPPITTTGANTMGCLINGEPFIAGRTHPSQVIAKWIKYSHYGDSIFSLVTEDQKINTTILLNTIYRKGQNEVDLFYSSETKSASTQVVMVHKDAEESFDIDGIKKGKVKILRDDEFVISGTFEFDAIGIFSGDTVRVTQGRFDVRK